MGRIARPNSPDEPAFSTKDSVHLVHLLPHGHARDEQDQQSRRCAQDAHVRGHSFHPKLKLFLFRSGGWHWHRPGRVDRPRARLGCCGKSEAGSAQPSVHPIRSATSSSLTSATSAHNEPVPRPRQLRRPTGRGPSLEYIISPAGQGKRNYLQLRAAGQMARTLPPGALKTSKRQPSTGLPVVRAETGMECVAKSVCPESAVTRAPISGLDSWRELVTMSQDWNHSPYGAS